jgi:predicted dehydrogenase
VRNLVRAIERNEPFQPDFEEGLRVQQVMAAIEESSLEQAWIEMDRSV